MKSHDYLLNDLISKFERITTDSSYSLDFFFFVFEKVMGLFGFSVLGTYTGIRSSRNRISVFQFHSS